MLYTTIGTTIFYVFVFGLVLLCACKGEQYGNQKKIIYAYFLLTSVTVFRYDIGNDYYGMATYRLDYFLSDFRSGYSVFDIYKEYDGRIELSYIFFVWLFSWSKYPYVYYIGLYGCISLFFLYKSLERISGSHTLGLFVYITSGILFNSWDWIRQSTAIMVVLYAIPYIENKDWKRYLGLILFSSLFHHSALLMLPIYLVRYFRLNRFILVGVLMIAVAFYLTGVLSQTLTKITALFSFVGGYENYAESVQSIEQITSVSYKIRSLLYIGLYIGIMLFLSPQEVVKRNLLFIGSVLFLIASGSQILQRISYYFLVVSVTSFPIVYRTLFVKKSNVLLRTIMVLIMFLMSVLWIRDIVTMNNRGCTPYDYIFSERFDKQWFRPKKY